MKKVIFSALITLMVLATSCVSQHNVNRAYTPMKPDIVRLDVTMADYEYLGDVTMEVVYKHYGLWRKVISINGVKYDPRYYTMTTIDFTKNIKMSNLMRKACYKIVDTYPNADYIVASSSRKEYQHMLAGRNIKETMTVKVFALRGKTEAKQAEEQLNAVKAQMAAEKAQMAAENSMLKADLQKAQDEIDRMKASTGKRR